MFSSMFKKQIKNTEEYLSLSKLAKEFNMKTEDFKDMLIKLNYIKIKDKWILPTIKGKSLGAEDKYNAKTKQKYTIFPKDMKQKIEIEEKLEQNIINKLKNKPKKRKMTYAEKKAKGDMYEEYIADFFKNKNFTVVEHGKLKDRKDAGIDLMVKQKRLFYFIQCKNWDSKINHKEIKATQADVYNYIRKNMKELMEQYEWKILYITSKDCLEPSAKMFIKENSDEIEYHCIPIK